MVITYSFHQVQPCMGCAPPAGEISVVLLMYGELTKCDEDSKEDGSSVRGYCSRHVCVHQPSGEEEKATRGQLPTMKTLKALLYTSPIVWDR